MSGLKVNVIYGCGQCTWCVNMLCIHGSVQDRSTDDRTITLDMLMCGGYAPCCPLADYEIISEIVNSVGEPV